MRNVEEWFDAYGESHQNPRNKLIHWICIPLIVFSLIGMLWGVRLPIAHSLAPWLNLGMVVVVFGILFYLSLSFSLALGMLALMALNVWGVLALDALQLAPLWQISIGIFVVAWIGQFIGHKIEGKKPSFFDDLKFLMIGPLWLLGFLYRKLGIPY